VTRLSSILCGVDSSEPAQAAFRQSLALSRARNAELIVVVAVPPNEPFNRRARQRIDKIAALRRASDAAGVRLRVSVQHGDPAGVILLHASSRDCDLIVLGTRRRSGLERLRAASVAEQVTRRAACPVLVVPAELSAVRGERPGAFRNVVCPVDFSAPSNAALAQALGVAEDSKGRLTLVHALPDPDPTSRHAYHFSDPRYGQLMKREAWQRLQDSVPPELRAATEVYARVVSGTPADEIAKLAREIDADLIVMGVTSRGAFGRRLFGSTAARVMRSASCPVLAVPEPVREEAALEIAPTSVAATAA
jgi:nucleotide-binding universal stress UspA family protein